MNTIDSILENAYQVRSDCVHGKPFADTLRVSLGTNFASELPKYELGIEMAARAVLENAITNQTILANSNSRLSLEAAWSCPVRRWLSSDSIILDHKNTGVLQ